ncbi:MAG: acetate--CoA ligase [Polyangiaceae bacterium]|nr:acetate--CoA ligase [Polyangiaceae bacterium]
MAEELGLLTRPRLDSFEAYRALYEDSVRQPEAFWSRQAARVSWHDPPRRALDEGPGWSEAAWYPGARLNVADNCADRHAARHPERAALVWAKNEPGAYETVTYRELAAAVGRLANALRARGVGRGDRVCIYMPMMPELVYAMLACARLGAVHSVVFAGFSASALRDRLVDSGAKVLVTANEAPRGPKRIHLKALADEAAEGLGSLQAVLVARRTETPVPMLAGRDAWLDEAMDAERAHCPAARVDAEDPLFVLYTSGSTGKPKGVVHTSGGYLVYASATHDYVFDSRPDDVFLCTADAGWITGHTYVVYGPLANGVTTVLLEAPPNYPDATRLWRVVDDLKATVLYTAPTALRSLMAAGPAALATSSRESLRVLGSAGEPINPEVWRWYHDEVGRGRCAVVDTWWQTETGGVMMAPLPGVTEPKPGAAMLPFFGVVPALVGEGGALVEGDGVAGNLCLARPWPGQARTLLGDHRRFRETYFARFPSLYFTGDGSRRDEDGHYWVTGRVDDVLNVSGHRLGTAEVESALVAHEAVAEAAVVGVPHPIKGEAVFAFVALCDAGDGAAENELVGALKQQVRGAIGPVATPDEICFVPGLPKTRSGKILRRMLRSLARNDGAPELGDASTLADPGLLADVRSAVERHFAARQEVRP